VNNYSLKKHQKGQSMIEYTVILIALTTTLYSVTQGSSTTGIVGTNKDQKGSLMNALHERYTDQSLAIRITELPEYRDLGEISTYYNQLNKFPTLSGQIYRADAEMDKLKNQLDTYNGYVQNLAKYKDIKNTAKDLMGDALEEFKSGILP
jgi:hypothetical protein